MPKEEFLAALDRFRLLFTLLDKIWSSVRGHEEGLLPTEEQLDRLQATITATKRVWLEVGLNIVHNPKAHALFDGHLLDQMRLHGGLADKADDEIERAHQTHSKLDRVTANLKNLEQRHACQQREVYLRANALVKREQELIAAIRKRVFKDSANKRARDERDENKGKSKKARREEAVDEAMAPDYKPIPPIIL